MELAYTELHCRSNFSFLHGASHPGELIERAIVLGYRGLAITDECSFAGSARAHLAWRDLAAADPAAREFRLIHGTEIALEDGPRLVLLATSRASYGNLAQLVSLARRNATKGQYRLSRAELEAHSHQLIGALALLLPEAIPNESHALWLAALMPRQAWIACELLHGADDAARLSQLQALSQASGLPLAAAGDVLMHRRSRKRLADVLAAVRHRCSLAELGRRLPANAEQYLRPLYRLARLYPSELLRETQVIAERCDFSLESLRYEYPEEVVPAGETATGYLRRITYEHAQDRYPGGLPDKVRAAIEHELKVIATLRYEPYFLTVFDIVKFARRRAILCQGRGSAANSAVCYCLGITEVDPARMSLLFERFMSIERSEPPDIDLDVEHERREEVLQYLFDKYGRHRTAMAAAIHTYRPRGAVRDVGKAMGLSLDQLDRLAKNLSWWDGKSIAPERVTEAGLDASSPRVALTLELTDALIGFPRHLTQHSCGVVITQGRLDRLVPIENAAMPDRTVIQWDKDDLDALGLMKVDVLALGMLSAIRRALDHLNRFHAAPRAWVQRDPASTNTIAPARLQDIPGECPAVYAMLSRGDSLGVFQVESRAQMNMLPRLAPSHFFDLVIETAIVRPGPIQGGMVHPYLRRRQGLEPVTYPSEAVRGVLERTLGVSIFQEQVMQLVVVAAGFTPGEADQVRRGMAAWRRRGGLEPFQKKLFQGMVKRGYTPEYAEQIYRQIQGFAEYGFPESHAASFALLVYVSAWLKCHAPAAFCAALLDAQPLGFYGPAQIVRDAQNHGVEVLPVDVAASDWHCRLVATNGAPSNPAVRLGMQQLVGFTEAAAQRISTARAQQAFSDAEDLARRATLSRSEIQCLAQADALKSLAGHRRQALWTTLGIDADAPTAAPLAAFSGREAQLELLPAAEGEEIVADYRHTALTLRRHPLALLRPKFDSMALLSAAQLVSGRHRQLVRTTGIVTCRQRPGTASGVTFVTLEDETGTINVVVWRDTAERYRKELLGATLLTVYGQLETTETRTGRVTHVIANRLTDHSPWLGELVAASRDFH